VIGAAVGQAREVVAGTLRNIEEAARRTTQASGVLTLAPAQNLLCLFRMLIQPVTTVGPYTREVDFYGPHSNTTSPLVLRPVRVA